MEPAAEKGGGVVKLTAAARTVSAVVWIVIAALAFGAPRPVPLWILLSLAATSAAAMVFLAMWKRMTGKTVLDRTFAAFAFLVVLVWVLLLV